MRIPANLLEREYLRYKQAYDTAAIEVLSSGWYVLGKRVEAFESAFAAFIGAQYCVGLNSGLDALTLALRALGVGDGDEVIVPANTYIASVLGITENGAVPVFVEPDSYYNLDPARIEEKITPKTKAILPVHLYGQACQMKSIREIARRHGLFIVEDCAQSHGARADGQMTGKCSDIGCFSFFPTKNLGAFGDAGAIVTDDAQLAETVRMLRNYGSRVKYHNALDGVNSRLDEMQAALLTVKLSHFQELTQERAAIAGVYLREIKNPLIRLPKTAAGCSHVYHQFVVRLPDLQTRERFIDYLAQNEIGSAVHYPIPPHLAECYRRLGYRRGDFPRAELHADTVVSLPLYAGMLHEETQQVIDIINSFC